MLKKVILITGASSGIGKETALQLIREGNIVYGAARRIEKMDDIMKAGGHAVQMDITDEEQIEKVVKSVISEQGRIDVLLNIAGYAVYGAIEDTTLEDARSQFDVNIFGLAQITKNVLPYMRERRSGRIINLSSMGGKIYTPLGAWYHATKHALEGWSDCLRLELKQFNIDVVIIEPGVIDTEFGDVLLDTMVKRSGNGPYSKLTHSVEKMTRVSYDKKGSSSPPSVISNLISKVIKKKNPKTRYVVGKMARPAIFIRKFFGDRMFDWMMMTYTERLSSGNS